MHPLLMSRIHSLGQASCRDDDDEDDETSRSVLQHKAAP